MVVETTKKGCPRTFTLEDCLWLNYGTNEKQLQSKGEDETAQYILAGCFQSFLMLWFVNVSQVTTATTVSRGCFSSNTTTVINKFFQNSENTQTALGFLRERLVVCWILLRPFTCNVEHWMQTPQTLPSFPITAAVLWLRSRWSPMTVSSRVCVLNDLSVVRSCPRAREWTCTHRHTHYHRENKEAQSIHTHYSFHWQGMACLTRQRRKCEIPPVFLFSLSTLAKYTPTFLLSPLSLSFFSHFAQCFPSFLFWTPLSLCLCFATCFPLYLNAFRETE